MPIFKFPVLVRELIVERMSLDDIFILSICSKRCYRTMQYFIRHSKKAYRLCVGFGDYWNGYDSSCGQIQVEIPSTKTKHEIVVNSMERLNNSKKRKTFSGMVADIAFVGVRETHFTNTYWEDTNAGIKALIVHMTELFNKDVNVSIESPGHPIPLPILEFINERQKSIPFANVELIPFDEAHVSTLDCLKNAEILEMNVYMKFDFDKDATRKWEHKKLRIRWAPWVNSSHLLRMNCNRLEFPFGVNKSADLNAYLKGWIEGAVPRLEHLTLQNHSHHRKGTLEGIPYRENPDRVLMTLSSEARVVIDTPVDICRNDGIVGTFFCSQLASELGWPSFQFDFVVWK